MQKSIVQLNAYTWRLGDRERPSTESRLRTCEMPPHHDFLSSVVGGEGPWILAKRNTKRFYVLTFPERPVVWLDRESYCILVPTSDSLRHMYPSASDREHLSLSSMASSQAQASHGAAEK